MRHFIFPFICLFLIASCKALHRGIPKSDDSYRKKKMTAVHEPKQEARVSSDTISPQPVEEIRSPESSSIQPTEDDVVSTLEKQELPVVIDDTIRKPALTANEVRAQEEESEEIAKKAYHYSFVPLLSIIFFPFYFIGLFATLSKIKRFKSYEYVTENGQDYIRRAIRTLIFSCLIFPLIAILAVVILFFLFY